MMRRRLLFLFSFGSRAARVVGLLADDLKGGGEERIAERLGCPFEFCGAEGKKRLPAAWQGLVPVLSSYKDVPLHRAVFKSIFIAAICTPHPTRNSTLSKTHYKKHRQPVVSTNRVYGES